MVHFVYNSKSYLGCGGVLHSQGGRISSPNWPGSDYLPNTECVWDIIMDVGYHVEMTFAPPSFDLEIQPGCPYDHDYVAVSQNGGSNCFLGVTVR